MGKIDAITKEFWRDNEHFADLFNAVIFQGEPVIHPITTIILYYGEAPWDGPKSLREMLVPAPEKIRTLTPDYPLNLIEIRNSEDLVFQNTDVRTVFSLVRKIYRKEIKDEEFYNVRRDLAETVGSIVSSEKLIKLARRSRKEEVNMCRALEEMMQEREMKGKREGERKGELRGEQRGIRKGKIEAYYDAGFSPEKIADRMKLSVAEVNRVLKR